MHPGNLLERVQCWCEHVFCTEEYTLGYYEIDLRSCVLNRHKMWQSQIVTIQESLPSHFVICRIFMIMAVSAQIGSNNTENVFWVLGKLPRFTFDINLKSFIFGHYGVISLLYLFLCVCISVIKPIINLQGNLIDSDWRRCVHVSCTEEYTLLQYGHESEKLHFEPSQNATVTNCDNSGILAFAFCDLLHFVIMAVMAETEYNNTENVFWVLGRVPRFTFDTNMKKIHFCPFWCYFTGIYVCVYVYQL